MGSVGYFHRSFVFGISGQYGGAGRGADNNLDPTSSYGGGLQARYVNHHFWEWSVFAELSYRSFSGTVFTQTLTEVQAGIEFKFGKGFDVSVRPEP